MLEDHSLRPATLEDLESVVAVEERIQPRPWSRIDFQEELKKPHAHFHLCTDDETDEQILGYVVFLVFDRKAEVLNLGVDLPYRGMGLGKKILERAIHYSLRLGAEEVRLNVRKSNLAAIALYQGMNFLISHVRKRFYSDGEDAYEMILDPGADHAMEPLTE